MNEKDVAEIVHAAISQFVETVFSGPMGGSATFDEHSKHVLDKARANGYGRQPKPPALVTAQAVVAAATVERFVPAPRPVAVPQGPLTGPVPEELSPEAAGAIPDFLAPPPEVERKPDYVAPPPTPAPVAPLLGEVVVPKDAPKRRSK